MTKELEGGNGMAKIIKASHTAYVEKKVRLFELIKDRNCCFQFDVVNGKEEFCCDEAKVNYLYCLGHPKEYEDKGIVTLKISYWQDARAICECGKEIYLRDTYMGAGQCGYCGRWHNLFGQEILPPEEWEAEERG